MIHRGLPSGVAPPPARHDPYQDVGRHLSDPMVSSMARSVLVAIENRSHEQIRMFSRSLLAVIAC